MICVFWEMYYSRYVIVVVFVVVVVYSSYNSWSSYFILDIVEKFIGFEFK